MVAKGSQLAQTWHAADSGEWCQYLTAVRGESHPTTNLAKDSQIPLVGRLTIAPHYQAVFDTNTGEVKTCRYDGSFRYALKGLNCEGLILITRLHEWRQAKAVDLGSANLEFCE
ncbi:hypothetical protein [Ferrimonas lipolytica]|uniref:Uncharacterized protein n=1 Tax=Ferrimonas lipolytica TaxID=2724191 RepID=A0A6H1UDV3_9GAMM|nr:hypothetical protein [Ferrimonas lipolytica]QIZ77265.1 hypothetical protein HER31_10470 [Ferrimonas lipolytica]